MNSNTNILIAIAAIGIGGIALYQFLFNFILPIALLVFVLNILSLLIKGFENNEEIEDVSLFEEKTDSSSTENVEVAPAEEIAPAEEGTTGEDKLE